MMLFDWIYPGIYYIYLINLLTYYILDDVRFVISIYIFNWYFFLIFQAYTPVLQRAVEIWYQDPQVTTPVLKLFAELVQNRSQRLQFDVSSPNGILLFREASKIICTYGKLL